jgi:hypothetical protein
VKQSAAIGLGMLILTVNLSIARRLGPCRYHGAMISDNGLTGAHDGRALYKATTASALDLTLDRVPTQTIRYTTHGHELHNIYFSARRLRSALTDEPDFGWR